MQKTIKFIPIDYDYFDFHGENYAKIIGRDGDGKKVCIIDSCDVYFWAILKDGVGVRKEKELCSRIDGIKVKVKGRESRVVKTEVHDKKFLGCSVRAIKVFISNYKDAHDIADKMGFKEIDKRREYDLSYVTKYIMDKKVRPLVWYNVEGELLNNSLEFGGIDASVDIDVIKVEKIKESEKQFEFNPRILAYDIETDEFEIGKSEILMISLVGEGFKKVLTWKGKSGNSGNSSHSTHEPSRSGSARPPTHSKVESGYVEHFKDEEEVLEKFVEYVHEYDPDLLVGYFSDGFDLPYLRARAEANRIKLGLGVDGSQPVFSRGRMLTGRIRGVVHVDLLRFIRSVYSQYLQSETLSLNDVANELLDEKKVEWQHRHSSKIHGKEWDEYFKYNLKDSDLTFRLAEKIWPDMLEFVRVVQEPLFDLSRDTMATNVESYVIHNVDKYDEIIEKRPVRDEIGSRRNEERYEGAFVFQPIPGLYDDVVFFDFTSMYASVIVTYNLSKANFLDKKLKNSLEVDLGREKAYFSQSESFFPKMLAEIIDKRKKYKKEFASKKDNLAKARSNAFKLLANAAYGYQGFFGARYYCLPAAAATAALARKEIKGTIDLIEKKGYKIVYSDTDSIAFLQGDKNKKEVLDLLYGINKKLPGIMELDLEGFFKRGIWVTKRTGDFGAKKKYALVGEDNKVKIRGFETVRRDWCGLARETQNRVLELILKNGNEEKAVEYLKGVIKKLKERKIDLKKLIIKTQLKKPIEDYKAVSPHVAIARRMRKEGKLINIGMLIEYYIAEVSDGKKGKKVLVRERAKLPDEKGKYDIEYYLKNQILPAVENILEVFRVDVNSLIDGKRQMSLGDY